MGLVQTVYSHIECNGPAATPFKAHCSAEVDGGWDQAEVEQRAVDEGWVHPGRSWLCPRHAPAQEEDAAAPAPAKSRRKKAQEDVTPAVAEQQEEWTG
jgi:hypothetical protein